MAQLPPLSQDATWSQVDTDAALAVEASRAGSTTAAPATEAMTIPVFLRGDSLDISSTLSLRHAGGRRAPAPCSAHGGRFQMTLAVRGRNAACRPARSPLSAGHDPDGT